MDNNETFDNPDSERLCITVCDREWIIERTEDLESLWDAMDEAEFGEDERLPYWAELWPASLGLGEWLCERKERIAGRTCLDLGCGLGLTAIIGASLGARMAALDYEWEPLAFARCNNVFNGVPQVLWLQTDWRAPGLRRHCFDVIWGADVMYEKRFIGPVAAFLAEHLAPDGTAWISEPDRNTFPQFAEAMRSRGWRCDKADVRKIKPLYEQPKPVTVNLWELAPGPTL